VAAEEPLLGRKHAHRAAFAANSRRAGGQLGHDALGVHPAGQHVAMVAIAGDNAIAPGLSVICMLTMIASCLI
jgi:hypothetical protein